MSNKLRPCTCDKVPLNGKFALGYCRACYLYWFDDEYGKRWGRVEGDQKPKSETRKGIPIKSLESNQGNISFSPNAELGNPTPKVHLNRSLPCVSLGNVVDRSSCNCPMKFIHHCEVHQFCHRGTHYSTVKSCHTCLEYEADVP